MVLLMSRAKKRFYESTIVHIKAVFTTVKYLGYSWQDEWKMKKLNSLCWDDQPGSPFSFFLLIIDDKPDSAKIGKYVEGFRDYMSYNGSQSSGFELFRSETCPEIVPEDPSPHPLVMPHSN
ncbi:Hypothetical predicted protein [Olea europaea subsp. europaea]|uniref:Uncharacterized protein n=1 Tax=Olea europaea subsp. europaea TaxID=158383 RepID=A0A8S0TLT1_OLEEU|nr:Hypothetical predicted protein [Olea europaea subsp. europaea]